MRAFDCIFGNAETVSAFRKSISSGKVAASYIIAGPHMSGKYTITKEFACSLTEKLSIDNADLMCKKIRDDISPDITVCRADDKKSIGIEDIRDIFGTVYTTPNELEFRMFIICDAQKLTVQAQNALLKVFEEPPVNAYIFLLCDSRVKLLATLISRAQNIDMEVFDKHSLDIYFKDRYDTETERAKIAYLLSYGALGKAEKLLSSDEEIEAYRAACGILKSFESKNSVASLDTCIKACSTRESCFETLRLLSDAVGDMMNVIYGSCGTHFFLTAEDAKHSLYGADAESIAVLADRLALLRDNLDFNASAASTATSMFIALKTCFSR